VVGVLAPFGHNPGKNLRKSALLGSVNAMKFWILDQILVFVWLELLKGGCRRLLSKTSACRLGY
jgi:hypothetical protein